MAATLLHANVQWTVGASPGLALPSGGDIEHYQAGFAPGIDLRLTGFAPVIGVNLAAAYASMSGPTGDSSQLSNRYVPVTVSIFTDFSPLIPNATVLPYLRLGLGPCYWDIRNHGVLFRTLDSTQSKQLDYDLQAAAGVEKNLGRSPLSVFAEVTADYITSTHYRKYGIYDKDDFFTVLRIGLRFHTR
jgi:hypothetical protein